MKKIFALKCFTVMVLLAGCATKTPVQTQKYIFFPGAPDPARLQFLTSYATARDLGPASSSFTTFITGAKPESTPIGKPYGVAMQEGKIYVCDSISQAVLILDVQKRRMSALPLTDEAALMEPVNITIDADGSRYIVDDRRDQVLCVDPAGQLKWVLGHKDEMRPRDIVATGDRLYVTDVLRHFVRVYDKKSLKLIDGIPNSRDVSNTNASLLMPSNLALDSKGQLYVSDTAIGRVEVYDKNGNYVRSIGAFGDDPASGLLKRPKGVAVARDGVTYVVDSAYQLVQMFDDQGRYLMCFGYPGSASSAGMTLPAKVYIDYDDVKYFEKYASPRFQVEYLVIITNQYGPRKVAIYGFGHEK